MCLGIYRIIEQAIVNSITHGPASKVKIAVGMQSDLTCCVTIDDDGPGANLEAIEAGFGTVLIDSWVSILKATKVVASSPGEGYSLTVKIAL
jgi:signal transduction histidine kinase